MELSCDLARGREDPPENAAIEERRTEIWRARDPILKIFLSSRI